ncbi:MAG: penicillin-insensitive murein endopeptidase, partial [Xanthobacteraceae bacterium]
MRNGRLILACLMVSGVVALAPRAASAQEKGTLHPKPLPALANPDDPDLPAKQLFGRKAKPSVHRPE